MDQVFHLDEGTSTSGGKLGQHIDGEQRPSNSAPREGLDPIISFGPDGQILSPDQARHQVDEARQYLVECREVGQKHRGPKGIPVRSILIAGLPPYADPERWEPFLQAHQQKTKQGADVPPPVPPVDSAAYRALQQAVAVAYTAAAVRHVTRRAGPGSKLIRCVLHQDEKSPHAHCQLVVADEGKRLGWSRIRRGFAVTGPDDRRQYNGPSRMGAVQDRFYEEVASGFGLNRGKRSGSDGDGERPRKRTPIDRENGLVARIAEEAAIAARAIQAETVLRSQAEQHRDAARAETAELRATIGERIAAARGQVRDDVEDTVGERIAEAVKRVRDEAAVAVTGARAEVPPDTERALKALVAKVGRRDTKIRDQEEELRELDREIETEEAKVETLERAAVVSGRTIGALTKTDAGLRKDIADGVRTIAGLHSKAEDVKALKDDLRDAKDKLRSALTEVGTLKLAADPRRLRTLSAANANLMRMVELNGFDAYAASRGEVLRVAGAVVVPPGGEEGIGGGGGGARPGMGQHPPPQAASPPLAAGVGVQDGDRRRQNRGER